MTLVHRFLEAAAHRTPSAPVLIEPTRAVTYADLEGLANRIAHLLVSHGVRRGDRVVMAADNCIELVASYLGAMKAGAAAVPLPGGPRSDRLARALRNCAPAACIVDAATAREAAPGHPLADVKSLFVLRPRRGPEEPRGTRDALPGVELDAALQDMPAEPPAVRSIDLDLAAIIYTSGSTGDPRGVMLTHRNIVANTNSIVSYLHLTATDRVMCVLPFYYVYGLSLLHTHLAVGGSVVIDNRFAFPNVVLKAMRAQRVTGFAGVPSTFALLLHRSSLESVALPDLRYITQAGGGMPVARIQEWLRRGPAVPFYVMYGATEASARLTYLEPSDLPRKIGSIGRAIPNVEIVVVREDGSRAAPGEVGELVARGSNISRGYWSDPEETARKFCPLGYRTGDLGYQDSEGFLFLVGRMHDMIKVGAHRVGSKEIEDILHEFPGVHEAAVVAAPHDLLGEVPVAFVSLRASCRANADDLHAFCGARLPAHKVPAEFVVLPDLPKMGSVGKIDKGALKAHARDAAAGVPGAALHLP